MIIFASASFAESSPFVFCLQALDSLMKCWHALMTGRELQHFSLQGYCLLISDCGHQHPVARTWNYHRQNTGHFEADSEEFLNTGKNGINIPLGFYTFLPYEADNPWWKAARSIWDRRCLQYLTEEIKNIIWSPEVFSSDSSIPASLPSFYICGVTMATVKTFYKIWGILRKRNSWMG